MYKFKKVYYRVDIKPKVTHVDDIQKLKEELLSAKIFWEIYKEQNHDTAEKFEYHCSSRTLVDINRNNINCSIGKAISLTLNQFLGTEDYYVTNLKADIIGLLKKRAVKMPVSDIDAHLKHKDVDELKELCEEMYHNGEIGRTGNYRYFILTDKKEKPKTSSVPKSDVLDVKSELKKFKEMLDEGLIEQEDYDAKKKELLGL